MTVPVSEVDAVFDYERASRPGEAVRAPIEARSPARIAWQRIRRTPVTLGALAVVVLFFVLAIAAPILNALHVIDPETPHPELVQGVGSTPTGPFSGASSKHWLGVVPGTGQDILARVMYGLTFDLSIAMAATIVTIVVGGVAGLVAGYFGRWVDGVLGRIMDLILAFPQLVMLLALSPLFVGQPPRTGRVVVYIIVVLGFFGWPYFARLIRGEVLSMRQHEYIEAARSLGAGPGRILWKELLPNLRGPILVYATIVLPTYVAGEAALAYLGISLQPPLPTLGSLLDDAVSYATTDPTYFFVPGIALVLVVLAFNLLGDGLGDALNPKAARR